MVREEGRKKEEGDNEKKLGGEGRRVGVCAFCLMEVLIKAFLP